MSNANRASARSVSVKDGAETRTFGRFIPLWSWSLPPWTTVQSMSGAVHSLDPQFQVSIVQKNACARMDIRVQIAVPAGNEGRRLLPHPVW